jgi:hypothetical protein
MLKDLKDLDQQMMGISLLDDPVLSTISLEDWFLQLCFIPRNVLPRINILPGIQPELKETLFQLFEEHYRNVALKLRAYSLNDRKLANSCSEESTPYAELALARFYWIKKILPRLPHLKRLVSAEVLWLHCEICEFHYVVESCGLTGSPLMDEDGKRVLSKTKLIDQMTDSVRQYRQYFKLALDPPISDERVMGDASSKQTFFTEILLTQALEYVEAEQDEVVQSACDEFLQACSEYVRTVAKGKMAESYQLYYLNAVDQLIITGKGRRIPLFKGFAPKRGKGRPRK